MTDVEALLTSLRSLRNTLASAVDQIDVILQQASEPSAPATASDEPCAHPLRFREAAPTMRHPSRTFCKRCGTVLED